MIPSIGKYLGTIAGTSGASGTLDLTTTAGVVANHPVWVQPRAANASDVRILSGTTASNTAGVNYGPQFQAGQLFPMRVDGTLKLCAIATDGASSINVDVWTRLD